MKLIIGGRAQGKLRHVLEQYPADDCAILDGAQAKEWQTQEQKKIIINHFHEWVRESIRNGEDTECVVWEYLHRNPDCIIISDEVGNGIVPIDAFEREYRERLGRILIEIAKEAVEVERVICGLGQKIK